MFEHLDKPLKLFAKVNYVVIAILIAGGFIGGVFMMIEIDAWLGILVWVGTALIAMIYGVNYAIISSFLSDVKLIRDKLYEEEIKEEMSQSGEVPALQE